MVAEIAHLRVVEQLVPTAFRDSRSSYLLATTGRARAWSGDVRSTYAESVDADDIETQTIRNITAPVLLLSGAKSYPFLGLITEELARLLPNHEIIVFSDAGHQMWYQAPDLCRKDVEAFLVRVGIQ
jgi:pimeloyl-ACP methyl ester carboxylesterase